MSAHERSLVPRLYPHAAGDNSRMEDTGARLHKAKQFACTWACLIHVLHVYNYHHGILQGITR